jgi:putative superfamily III holin-X
LPADPGDHNDSLAAAVTEVSEKLSVLVREEIELAKAEMTTKVSSLARGAVAVAIGAVFGVFALVFVLLTIAWGLNVIIGSFWLGFAIVMVLLVVLTVGAFLFAWRKLKVGAPTPKMAISEAKKIRATVKSGADS